MTVIEAIRELRSRGKNASENHLDEALETILQALEKVIEIVK